MTYGSFLRKSDSCAVGRCMVSIKSSPPAAGIMLVIPPQEIYPPFFRERFGAFPKKSDPPTRSTVFPSSLGLILLLQGELWCLPQHCQLHQLGEAPASGAREGHTNWSRAVELLSKPDIRASGERLPTAGGLPLPLLPPAGASGQATAWR